MNQSEEQRRQMVETQLKSRGLREPRLLKAFGTVPRHHFVPEDIQSEAYTDHPLPIGAGQTISQPYIVGLMIDQLRLQGHERVLEVGAGTGYQTAILAELTCEVYAVERIAEVLEPARVRLQDLGYLNVHLSQGNGSLGWPEHAPYDAIIVSAAAPKIPEPLLAQLADPGRMVLPVGSQETQSLLAVERRGNTVRHRVIAGCMFVPLLGLHGWPEA